MKILCGAGKTTLLEGLSGVIPSAGGSIEIDGHEIHRARPGARVNAGLAHVEQGRTVFRELTTDENLRAGAASASSPCSPRTCCHWALTPGD